MTGSGSRPSRPRAAGATALCGAGEGLLQLDDPVERHLPGPLRGKGVDGNAITVRQLLQHTSGLPEFTDLFDDQLTAEALRRFSEPHQLLALALSRPATFPPGTSWSYSNTDYVVAGLLGQQVTGPAGRGGGHPPGDRAAAPGGHLRAGRGRAVAARRHPHGYSAADRGDPGST